eukprot:1162062-Pelagomonas_calceolata.AAC.12
MKEAEFHDQVGSGPAFFQASSVWETNSASACALRPRIVEKEDGDHCIQLGGSLCVPKTNNKEAPRLCACLRARREIDSSLLSLARPLAVADYIQACAKVCMDCNAMCPQQGQRTCVQPELLLRLTTFKSVQKPAWIVMHRAHSH